MASELMVTVSSTVAMAFTTGVTPLRMDANRKMGSVWSWPVVKNATMKSSKLNVNASRNPATMAGRSWGMVTWRKVRFPARPAPGDLLVYPNTAGYQMDSNESPFHDLPLPLKVVLDTAGGATRWRLDRHPLA